MTRRITWKEARDFYDKLGPHEDLESSFQDRVFDRLVAEARFGEARSVFELGCGTGRFAKRLFEQELSPSARYVGVDVSGRMVGLAREKLEPWAGRAEVLQTEGELRFAFDAGGFDRFVSTYVLDLLSEEDIETALDEAWRLLGADGLLCVISLSFGETPVSHAIARTWDAISGKFPAHLGGCRPIRLGEFLSAERWQVEHDETVTVLAVPSDVVIARRVGPE